MGIGFRNTKKLIKRTTALEVEIASLAKRATKLKQLCKENSNFIQTSLVRILVKRSQTKNNPIAVKPKNKNI